jgi:hypothetical protein
MDDHRAAVAGGDGDAATTAAAAAEAGHAQLADGVRRLAPLVEAARTGGTDGEREELQRQIDSMMDQARAAETAIQNLTRQLEVWHAAYSRQLAEVGVVAGEAAPGASDTAAPLPAGAPVPGSGAGNGAGVTAYDRRGPAVERSAVVRPLIDRRG